LGSENAYWDKDRIADIDAIVIKNGHHEYYIFPVPSERVTMNEYLELAKLVPQKVARYQWKFFR